MVSAYSFWVYKSHFESRWGDHGARLGGLGGYLGARWGQLVPCRSNLGAILGELGATWLHFGFISLAKWKSLNLVWFYSDFCTCVLGAQTHLGSLRGSLGEILVILGATLGLCCTTLGNLEAILEELGRHFGQP